MATKSRKFQFLLLYNSLIIVLLPTITQPFSLSPKKSVLSSHDNPSARKMPPLFIAHRGDKFTLPEHTIPAYDVALLTNVDYVEPDLVMTKDGVLVCYHDITLEGGTDVADHPEFASLMIQNKTFLVDGQNLTILGDWLIKDFTLAQLSTLRVNQIKSDWRPQYFNGFFGIPTFQQYLDTVHKHTWRKLRKSQIPTYAFTSFVPGIIPELKHPRFHNDVFNAEHRMETDFLQVLKSNGYLDNNCHYNGEKIPCSPLVVQCFDAATIKYLSETTDLNLMMLLDVDILQNLRYLTVKGMEELVNKANFLGIWKELLYTGTEKELTYLNLPYDKREVSQLGGFVAPQNIVRYAHSLGFKVGIFTIYHSSENSKRGCAIRCETNATTKAMELNFYLDMGVDAFFVEGLSESLRIRDRWLFDHHHHYSEGSESGPRSPRMRMLSSSGSRRADPCKEKSCGACCGCSGKLNGCNRK